jgi:hypothetical protein
MTIKKTPNTECVYETIGNYPVVDQFDVLYTDLLSGSYVDNYVTGSLIAKVTVFGDTKFIIGERGLAFNKLDKNKSYPIDIGNTGEWTSYGVQHNSERSGFIRISKIFSSSEKYYDSMPPDYIEIMKLLGAAPPNVSAVGDNLTIVLYGSNKLMLAGSTEGFSRTFPFEGRFTTVQRQMLLTNKVLNDGIIILIYHSIDFPPLWIWQNTAYAAHTPPPLPQGTTLSKSDISKILFGFGDWNLRYKDGASWYGDKNLVMPRVKATGGDWTAYIGTMQRGWKYGLISGLPSYTSAVFRRDKYGQFRDMLEQRYSAAAVIDPVYSPTKYLGEAQFGEEGKPGVTGGNIEETATYTADPAVKVSFLKPDVVANKLVYLSQEPENTWSSNLSPFATSSLPFFDGEERNRGPITAGNVPASVSFTITSDTFGNLTLLP